jgi:hypothetical protein
MNQAANELAAGAVKPPSRRNELSAVSWPADWVIERQGR